MKILAIDSSGLVASAAVLEDGLLLAEYTVNYKKTHSQTLLPMIDEISRMLVKNIAEICETFGMKCIAEGVETEKQRQILIEAGCRCAQGYYYDRPMPAAMFESKYLNSRDGEQETGGMSCD